MIRVTPLISLDDGEIEESFVQASGPGGQNVNKVATAVRLRFDAAGSPSLPEPVRYRLKHLAGRRLGRDGIITIMAQRFRSQEQNRRDALDRLIELIRLAAVPPTPRVPTRPTRASRIRRLESKTRRSNLKRTRGDVPDANA